MSASDGPLADLLDGSLGAATVFRDGSVRPGVDRGLTVLSGAFNPLHEGHAGLLKAATGITGSDGAFELSVVNVDKPELSVNELLARLEQFAGRYTVVVSRAPTFVEKSRLMPGTVFVIGYDTAVRLLDDRYYPPYRPDLDPDRSGSATLAAMAEIGRNGCSFLVAGRVTGRGFKTVDDLDVPPECARVLRGIPEEAFRADISSTEIRRRRDAR